MLSTTQTDLAIGILTGLVIAAVAFARIRPSPFNALVFAPLWLPFLAMLCVSVALASDIILDRRDHKAFDKISKADIEVTVERALGRPDSVQSCGISLWWGYDSDYVGKNDGRCVKWVRYDHFLSAWAIGYSADGKVVSKYHYFSE
jgi:hypothetical protein